MRRWTLLGMAAVLATSVATAVATQTEPATAESGDATTSITLWVVQELGNPSAIYVSNRTGRHKVEHVALRAPIDEVSSSGRHRYGDITVELPVTAETDRVTVKVDVRIWQDSEDPLRLFISARAQGDRWGRNGTRAVQLDETTYFQEYRYGSIPVEIPWDPSVSPPAPVASAATFVWVDDLATDRQVKTRAHLDHVMAFYQDRFGLEPQPFTLVVAPDNDSAVSKLESLTGIRWALGASGYTGWTQDLGHFVIINDFNYALVDRQENLIGPSARGVLAHEYFHVLQRILSGHKTAQVPDWLEEGTAVYLTDRYLLSGLADHGPFPEWSTLAGYRPAGSSLLQRRESAAFAELPLKTLEDGALFYGLKRPGPHPGYDLGFLAVRWLVERAGEESVVDFWRELRESDTWQDAFAATFGMTTESFYGAFEEYREEVLPTPHSIKGTVLGPDGEPLQGILVDIWQHQPVPSIGRRRTGFESTATGEDGTFEVRFLDEDYKIALNVWPRGGERKQLGWYNGEGIGPCSEAVLVTLSGADLTGITIRLPADPSDIPDARPPDQRWTNCAE